MEVLFIKNPVFDIMATMMEAQAITPMTEVMDLEQFSRARANFFRDRRDSLKKAAITRIRMQHTAPDRAGVNFMTRSTHRATMGTIMGAQVNRLCLMGGRSSLGSPRIPFLRALASTKNQMVM